MALSAEESRAVEAAFEAAQARTRAPLVGVLAAASSDHAFMPVLWSGLLALATPWPLLVLTRLSAERIFLAQLVVCLVAMAVLSLPPVRVLLISRRARRAHAHRAALVQYSVRGIDRAPDRAGVLVYVSLAERYARVIADEGACRVVSAAQWQGVVDELVADLGGGQTARAMSNAAARCADLLAPDFPANPSAAMPHGQRFHVV
jgi:putative membrane protein